jgi:Protein of unknown function (DUF1552)
MKSYRFSRRHFMQSVGAASGLHALLSLAEARAEGEPAPKRFLVLFHPVGGLYDAWSPKGSEAAFTLSPILAPFEPLRERMVILDGMKLLAPSVPGTGGGGCHEANTVCLMSGVPYRGVWPGGTGDDARVDGPTIDQLFLKLQPALASARGQIPSLQIMCDERTDEREYSCRRISASGAGAPLDPYLSPAKLYDRVFGSFMPGGATPANQAELERARARRKSVLDFSLRDLARLEQLAPASERERLEAHATLIRELEQQLDAGSGVMERCSVGARPQDPSGIDRFQDTGMNGGNTAGGDQGTHRQIAELHFAVLRTALACDMTRVATFQYSPGNNHVSFQGFYPGDPASVHQHHGTSHEVGSDAKAMPFLVNVSKWYSEITAAFLSSLAATPDLDGKMLLDNTLVSYVTDLAEPLHDNSKIFPVSLFGGSGVGLRGGTLKRYGADTSRRPMNDMWLACAQLLDVPLTSLGSPDMFTGPLSGLS